MTVASESSDFLTPIRLAFDLDMAQKWFVLLMDDLLAVERSQTTVMIL